MRNNLEFTDGSNVEAQDLYTFSTEYWSVPKTNELGSFVPYTSRYAGGFNLMNTMKAPKACAFSSQNLAPYEYYRGQNTMQYDIFMLNSAPSLM